MALSGAKRSLGISRCGASQTPVRLSCKRSGRVKAHVMQERQPKWTRVDASTSDLAASGFLPHLQGGPEPGLQRSLALWVKTVEAEGGGVVGRNEAEMVTGAIPSPLGGMNARCC